MDQRIENARVYQAPELYQYGRLESLTGAVLCTGNYNKVGNDPDDNNPGGNGLTGDPVCR